MSTKIVKAKKQEELLISVTPPSENMETAAKIEYFHKVSLQGTQLSIQAALLAGLLLAKVQEENRGTFQAWVEANCSFGKTTAYKYLTLVQQALPSNELPKLANGSDEQRHEAAVKFAANTDSKNLTELYCDYGLIKKTKSNLGGYREGAGRKRKDVSELAKAAQDIANDPELAAADTKQKVSEVYEIAIVRGCFGLLTNKELKEVLQTLKTIVQKGEEIVSSRKDY